MRTGEYKFNISKINYLFLNYSRCFLMPLESIYFDVNFLKDNFSDKNYSLLNILKSSWIRKKSVPIPAGLSQYDKRPALDFRIS